MMNMNRQHIVLILGGTVFGCLLMAFSGIMIHETSTSEFCMSCHEMHVVGKDGWMHSAHYNNPKGVVAECKDCHIPPEFAHMLWTKARDGSKDVFVHFFGESDPNEMRWLELREHARRKISDSACRKCHENLTPKGAKIKTIIAHRAYQRLDGQKKCLDCHREEFHGRFREILSDRGTVDRDGGQL